MQVLSLVVYPMKSMGGIELSQAMVEEAGFRWDRRWMLTDEGGKFLTQRELPQMALIKFQLGSQSLTVDGGVLKPGFPLLSIPISSTVMSAEKVVVWKDEAAAGKVSSQADAWFTELLGRNCRLWRINTDIPRVHQVFGTSKVVSFADSQPFLIIGQASLDWLNQHLPFQADMARFRPNLVLSTSIPFEEDSWDKVQVGNVRLEMTGPCGRCKIVNIEQQTGKVSPEVLQKLRELRTNNQQVNFGMRAKPAKDAIGKEISVGDMVIKH